VLKQQLNQVTPLRMRVPLYVKEEEVLVLAADVTRGPFAKQDRRLLLHTSLSQCSALETDGPLRLAESFSALSPATNLC